MSKELVLSCKKRRSWTCPFPRTRPCWKECVSERIIEQARVLPASQIQEHWWKLASPFDPDAGGRRPGMPCIVKECVEMVRLVSKDFQADT